MKSPSLKAVTEVTCLAPQFLVDDLSEAMSYYRDRLGFEPDFVYESFYASVSRDGFSIHLKCSPKTVADFDLAVDFIGFGRPAAGRPNPMKSTAKSKMDKVE